MFIDLNCFLRWVMWPMGLLLSSYIKQLLYQCVKTFSAVHTCFTELPMSQVIYLPSDSKPQVHHFNSVKYHWWVCSHTNWMFLITFSIYKKTFCPFLLLWNQWLHFSPCDTCRIIHMIGCFLVMEQLKTVRGNEVAAEL